MLTVARMFLQVSLLGTIFGWCAFGVMAGQITETKDYFIQTIGIEDGLPHELTHRVVQDATGFLWISTSGGLVRYDGNRIQLYNSPLIRNEESDVIYAITRGNDGALWAAPNSGGLVEFNDGRFLPRADKTNLPAIPPTFLTQTPDGAFWIGYFEAKLVRWKDGQAHWFTREDGLTAGQTISLATNGSRNIWIASDSFLGEYEQGRLVPRFDSPGTKLRLSTARSGGVWVVGSEQIQKIENGKLVVVSSNTPWAVVAGTPSAVFEDSTGTLWIGTKGLGFYRFARGVFEKMPSSHPWITDIDEDHEGNIWVTTRGGGLDRLRAKRFLLFDAKVGLPESVSTSLCEDGSGNLWFAYDGNALVKLQQGDLDQKQAWQSNIWKSSLLVCRDHDNGLWVATRTSLWRWPASGEPLNVDIGPQTNISIHCLFNPRGGGVWAGGERGFLGRWREGAWTLFDTSPYVSTNAMVRCLQEDSNGAMWIAFNSGDMLKFENDRFTHFDQKNGLGGSMVRSMFLDSANHLWLATTRDGLLLRDGETFRHISTKEGLPDELVDQILEDDSHRVWFGTQIGLYYLGRDELYQCALGKIPRVNPVIYGRDAGLMGDSAITSYQPTACKSHDGHLWFATYKGVISVDPASVKLETNPPPVVVDAVLLDDQPAPIRNAVVIPAKTRKLEVRLSVIHFSAPSQVKIRHWLENFDSTWVDAGNQRSITYPKLPPGNYTLRFEACSPDGIWNEQTAPLQLAVTPAWWQIRWLQIVSAGTLIILLVLAVRTWSLRRLQLKLERLEQKQAMEKERARIAKNLHDDLGASLTELGLLADLARSNGATMEKLKDLTGFFSDRARGLARALDAIVWTVNPTNDSLHELSAYISEFSQELFAKTSVSFRLDVDENIPQRTLSPEERSNLFLTAKEAINNVIKHSGATEAWLTIKTEGDNFHITIRDNGRGFNPTAAENVKRNGLANMHSRIQELNGSFSIDSTPGQGTTISISVQFLINTSTKL
jgi:signal transduction histidine kinase/ligand-binding sensor domain-containing protein